ncbi:MAG TPA: fatty acid desaturase [Stellaceae bacterium]|nr:fatty acid desaturase [Stellaceae bacterium]
MTAETADLMPVPISVAATPSARGLLGLVDLRVMGRRSNLQGAARSAVHLGCLGATGLVVWLALPHWYLLLPAMLLHGLVIVATFAPMHECTHRTAFASPAANAAIGWIAGVIGFYNSTYYRHFHAWHHRYTQDPARDPELMFPRASSRLAYLGEVCGLMFWVRRAIDYPRLALGRTAALPFVPASARRAIALSMSAQLAIYAAAAAAILLGWTAPLYFWFLPALLAMPLLRAYLITEHTGCSRDGDGLSNTRTTLTAFPVRLLMWNMPYHAEHHLFPAVPFHRLPALHAQIGGRLAHVAPGYIATNRAIWHALP